MPINIHVSAETAEEARKQMIALLGTVELVVEGPAPTAGEIVSAAPVQPVPAPASGGNGDMTPPSAPVAAAPEPPKRGRAKKTEPAIRSNPENRIDPADAAQDVSDEAQDVSGPTPDRKLELNDVRAAVSRYREAYGDENAVKDIGPVVQKYAVNISSLPDDQEVLGAVVTALNDLLAKNPHGRVRVSGEAV